MSITLWINEEQSILNDKHLVLSIFVNTSTSGDIAWAMTEIGPLPFISSYSFIHGRHTLEVTNWIVTNWTEILLLPSDQRGGPTNVLWKMTIIRHHQTIFFKNYTSKPERTVVCLSLGPSRDWTDWSDNLFNLISQNSGSQEVFEHALQQKL